jgi:hypothetical protein
MSSKSDVEAELAALKAGSTPAIEAADDGGDILKAEAKTEDEQA